jgi:hypothetical protein
MYSLRNNSPQFILRFGKIKEFSSATLKELLRERNEDKMSVQKVTVIDYRKANAAHSLLPKPSILSSSGWSSLHLEVYQQPKFEIAEHQHTMHIIACGLPRACHQLSQITAAAR